MCHRMYSSLLSRNLVFYSDTETTRLLEGTVHLFLVCGQMEGTVHLCIGMRTDGRNGAPVSLVGFRYDGNAPAERMCIERHEQSAL